MSWPTGLTEWMTYLRRFRRRSAADQALLASIGDIQARTEDIQAALTAIRSRPVPRVALAFEVVTETSTAITQCVELHVLPKDLATSLREERVALARTLRAIQLQLSRLRFVSGIFQTKKFLPAKEQQRIINNVRTHRVCDGETLASIASEELLARDRWPELVELNQLTWPYIGWRSAYPNAVLVQPGEELLLPALDPSSQLIPRPAPTANDAYGIDIDLSMNPGQISVERGDVAVRSGVANVEQAIRLRVLTTRGSLPLHPDYGCGLYRWLGQEGSSDMARLALFDYVRSVLEDPRVTAVNRRTATLDGTTALLSLDAVVTGIESPVRLNAIVPALGG